MAERILSPGVFTNEVDQSFLAGGIAQIGAAVVGPTVKGPALIPTQITSYGEFESVFGSYTNDSYVPFVVQDYLRNGNVITVTRLLYEDGYKLNQGGLAIIASSGSGAAKVEVVTHVLHPTQAVTTTGTDALFEDSVLLDGTSGSFAIKISGSYAQAVGSDATAIGFDNGFLVTDGTAISASINATANSYITKVFSTSPKSTDYPVYVQYENKSAASLFANLAHVTLKLAIIGNYEFLQDYSTAATPWVTSQKASGNITKDMFRFHTLSHGTSVNHEVKIAIRDLRLATESVGTNGWSTFSIDVRRVNTTNIANSPYSSTDTDSQPNIVETFNNVTLNPESPRFISRVIGDVHKFVDNDNNVVELGDYPNVSKFIRVELSTTIAQPTDIPFGFRAVKSPIPMPSGSVNLAATTYITSQAATTYSPSNYVGFDFVNINNLNYLAPIPTSGSTTASNTDFYLGDVSQPAGALYPSSTPYSGSLQNALTSNTFTENVAITSRKFIVGFQGGFDGARPNLPKYSGTFISETNTFGFDCSTNTSSGTVAYNKAFSILSNSDNYDMNMLITPGIIDRLHSIVTLNARNLVEGRQDSFYVMDSNALTDSITEVVNQVQTLNSNYSAAYWPWIRITNPGKNVPVWVPPSVVVPGVLAFNDLVSAPWYAPAGLTRGGLSIAKGTYRNLSQSDRNTLYTARVNPIANFPNEGIAIWGQKTLQDLPSALDRVNVRRLLIAVKKFIASSTRYLVFEQNTIATRNRFLNIANPYLEQVRANQGLYAFRVVMDETNNTPDLIDTNTLYGQIFLQPTRTAEFIVLDFNIQPTGASFEQ
jgi:hypothetical protein